MKRGLGRGELTVKVEKVGVEGRGDGLVVRVVVGLEVRVLERLLDRHPLLRVDCTHPTPTTTTRQFIRLPPLRMSVREKEREDVHVNVLCKKSHACGLAFGNNVPKAFFFLNGNARM